MEQKSSNKMKGIIFRGVGLAMGIAVLIMNILGNVEIKQSITLLSIAVVAYGLYLFENK